MTNGHGERPWADRDRPVVYLDIPPSSTGKGPPLHVQPLCPTAPSVVTAIEPAALPRRDAAGRAPGPEYSAKSLAGLLDRATPALGWVSNR